MSKLKEGWAQELRRQREAWAAAEKAKREQWLESKTREVKELTVKGLEGEVRTRVGWVQDGLDGQGVMTVRAEPWHAKQHRIKSCSLSM